MKIKKELLMQLSQRCILIIARRWKFQPIIDLTFVGLISRAMMPGFCCVCEPHISRGRISAFFLSYLKITAFSFKNPSRNRKTTVLLAMSQNVFLFLHGCAVDVWCFVEKSIDLEVLFALFAVLASVITFLDGIWFDWFTFAHHCLPLVVTQTSHVLIIISFVWGHHSLSSLNLHLTGAAIFYQLVCLQLTARKSPIYIVECKKCHWHPRQTQNMWPNCWQKKRHAGDKILILWELQLIRWDGVDLYSRLLCGMTISSFAQPTGER